jgi:hypothetical protein
MTPSIAKKAWRLLEAAKSVAEKQDKKTVYTSPYDGKKYHGHSISNHLEEIQVHCDGYAEPGYNSESGVIATGNWNNVDEYNARLKCRDGVSNLPSRLLNAFEKLGIECEWSDEWSSCSDCGKLVRTSADSYSWQPSFISPPDSGEIICHECVKKDPEEYLSSLEGNHETCCTISGINPSDYDYVKVNDEDYESGLYGRTDNPATIAAKLSEKGCERFIFVLEENQQFCSRFSVYVHKDEHDKLNDENAEENESE